MKYKLGFVLGRETALSVAEISAVLARKGISWETDYFQSPIFIIGSERKIELKLEELGGTVKIFDVICETRDIAGEIKKWPLPQKDNRVNFGLSFYGVKPAKYLGLELKRHFRDQGLRARNVVGKRSELSSVIIRENKLIERGFEAVIVKNKDRFILGRTVEVQDYKTYSLRDFGRPARDDRSGMLPPKLAKMMVNLAGLPFSANIYDPFCGSGTIVQEAILLGYNYLFASDISDRALADTKANLNWLEQLGFSKSASVEIFRNDILKPEKFVQTDAIVAEGFLGQPILRDRIRALNDIAELTGFYIKAIKNIKKTLKPGGTIVLALPFFIVKKERFYLETSKVIEASNLKLSYPEMPLTLTGQKTLTYSRPDQFVGREIIVLK